MAEPDSLDTVQAQTAPLQASLSNLTGLADGFGRAMTSAFKGAVAEGKDLDDVLRSLALSLSGKALGAALAPIGRGLDGIFSGLFGGLGGLTGAASGAAASPLTRDGGIAAPGYFPRTGEISRSSAASGGQAVTPGSAQRAGPELNGVHVSFNVTARDADSFRRSEAELTAMLARTVARGKRGL